METQGYDINMKYGLLILVSVFFCLSGIGQKKAIPVGIIYNCQNKDFLVKKDSFVMVYDLPIIEINKLAIKITESFWDIKENEIRLVGRVFYKDTLSYPGMPGVGIFKGVKSRENVLASFEFVAATRASEVNDSIGLFDVTVKCSKGESLFFYMPYFYLEEFKLGSLVKELSAFSPKSKKKRLVRCFS